MSEVPFKHELEESEYRPSTTDALKSFKDRPDKVVRVYDGGRTDYKEHIAELNESKKHFKEMEEEYGIRVVNMDFVIGKDENDRVVTYTVVDNIIGKNLDKIYEFPTALKQKVENLFYSLAKYYNDKFDAKTKFWSDFRNDQFVYGHKINETEDSFYLVDVDPAISNVKGSEFFFAEIIDCLWHYLLKVEKRFKPPVEFSKTRQMIAEIKDKISKESK